jgi:AraC-like DNA-binding protein
VASFGATIRSSCIPTKFHCETLGEEAIRDRNSRRPWRKSFPISKLKSSSAPIEPKDLWCFHAVGSSNGRLRSSTATDGSQRIGKTSIARRWRSCALHRSASCFENSAIPHDVPGQTLSAVAQRSPAHLFRSFKQAFGGPPHAYVIKRRLERACHLMVTTSESLSQIALRVGFSDQSHLHRSFQRAFGQSPSIWRRHHKIQASISRGGIGEEC